MKKVRVILTAAAFVAGIGGAFATRIIGNTQEIFYLNESGQPTEQVESPDCTQNLSHDCAQLYNVDASGNPTTPAAAPIKGDRN